MTSLSLRGWGWRHTGRKAWALRGVDLHVDAGERVLLLGPSGAGKSTLLAAVAGLLDPGDDGNGDQEGEVLVHGVPAHRARTDAVTSGRGQARTGLLLQDPQAQTVLARCGDDVAFGLENHGVPADRIWPRVDRALDDVGLAVGRDHPTARLSGGQRQRLALAGVLALRPRVLLLDEPTSMLDPDAGRALTGVVRDQLDRTGATCVLVEHRVATWRDVVTRVVVLEPGGGVIADGTPDAVLAGQGAALAARGVWVPGHLPTGPTRPAGRRDGPVLLRADGLAVTRRGRPDPVLAGVDLDVVAGRATALMGPNGGGKSTLALTLGGLARPAAGTLHATDALTGTHTRPAEAPQDRPRRGRRGRGPTADPTTWRPVDLVARIGSVFQDPRHQFVDATVRGELAVGPRLLGVPDAETTARVDDLLDRLRLTHLALANPFTLSGGEQRRLSVATALATRPRVLVLDEPTFGQDSRTWAELADLLAALLDDGTAVVTATHDLALVHALADDVVTIDDGRATVRATTRATAPHDPAAGPR